MEGRDHRQIWEAFCLVNSSLPLRAGIIAHFDHLPQLIRVVSWECEPERCAMPRLALHSDLPCGAQTVEGAVLASQDGQHSTSREHEPGGSKQEQHARRIALLSPSSAGRSSAGVRCLPLVGCAALPPLRFGNLLARGVCNELALASTVVCARLG